MIHSFGSDVQAVSAIQIADWLASSWEARFFCLSSLLASAVSHPCPSQDLRTSTCRQNAQSQPKLQETPAAQRGTRACPADIH
ncbi:hypothetical protein BDV12DRAFT_85833 [Aspergillus spectabilis]